MPVLDYAPITRPFDAYTITSETSSTPEKRRIVSYDYELYHTNSVVDDETWKL